MTYKGLLTLNALVSFVYGVGALLTPALMLNMHAMDTNPSSQLMVRFFGSTLLGFAFLSWLSRNTADTLARRSILFGFLAFEASGVIVAAAGTLAGIMGPFGWSVVGLLFLLGVGSAYLLFTSR